MTQRLARGLTLWRTAIVLAVAVAVLAAVIAGFVARLFTIPSGSMETTLHGCAGCDNDEVLVDRTAYWLHDPRPGDIVVFVGPPGWQEADPPPEPANPALRVARRAGAALGLVPSGRSDFIKRVIAIGGQTVSCCDDRNRVLVDGRALDEPYIYFLPEAGAPAQVPFGPVRVPPGQLWVMGDSRNYSVDSRAPGQGPVPVDDVIGRARWIVLPLGRLGRVEPRY